MFKSAGTNSGKSHLVPPPHTHTHTHTHTLFLWIIFGYIIQHSFECVKKPLDASAGGLPKYFITPIESKNLCNCSICDLADFVEKLKSFGLLWINWPMIFAEI